jgi:hypothetical protein
MLRVMLTGLVATWLLSIVRLLRTPPSAVGVVARSRPVRRRAA